MFVKRNLLEILECNSLRNSICLDSQGKKLNRQMITIPDQVDSMEESLVQIWSSVPSHIGTA